MIIDETKLEKITTGNIPDIGRAEIFIYDSYGYISIDLVFDGFTDFNESNITDESNWEKIRKYIDEMFCYESYKLFLIYRELTIQLERLKDSTIILITNTRERKVQV